MTARKTKQYVVTAVDSLPLAIELFNLPISTGREHATVMLAAHVFEMLLKFVVVVVANIPRPLIGAAAGPSTRQGIRPGASAKWTALHYTVCTTRRLPANSKTQHNGRRTRPI